MDWTTIYEISRFMLPMNLLIGALFIFAGSSIIRGFWDRKDKKQTLNLWTAVKLFFSLIAVILGTFLLWTEADTILDGNYNAAAKAYHSGEYAVVEGHAEDVEWSVGGYSFSIGGKEFFCEQNIQARQRNDVQQWLGDERTVLQVSYYGEGYFDERLKQYEVVRIDVRTYVK